MSESTWDDPRITAYVLGELSSEEKSGFEAQCESDPMLAAAVDEARGVTSQLQELYARESTPPLDRERRDAIVSNKIGSVTLPNSQSTWRVPTLILAAAAVLLLLLGLAPWLRQRDLTVAMEDSEQKQQTSVVAAEASENSPQVVELESSDEETEMELSAIQSVAVSADDAPDADQLHEFSMDSPAAMPSTPAQEPDEPMAGREKPIDIRGRRSKSRDAGELALTAPQSGSSREFRSFADKQSGIEPKKQQSGQAASTPHPAPAALADEPYSIRGELKRKSGVVEKQMEMKEAETLADVEFAPESGNIVISGSKKSDLERVEEAIKQLEKLPRGQAARPATPALAASPKPQAMRELKKLEASDALAGRGGAAFGGGAAVNRRSRHVFVPALGENPIRQGEMDFAEPNAEGRGPGIPGDQFEPITDNPFKRVSEAAFSTFSVDVDTASYSKTRDFLMRAQQLPRRDAVRIEELINYFEYDYRAPKADAEHPFATHVEVTDCPWNTEHRLARIGLKGKTMTAEERPPCNLVFLLDTSGSMNAANKLPLVIEGMKMLVDQLTEKDQVAITVYAGSAGLVLDSTSAKKAKKIRKALTQLSAGGSTNGGAGIALAYQTARDNFIRDGVNRVILCTDGDFNVGMTGTDALVRMVEQEAKGGIFLSVLGFGMGNHNDAMLEKVSGRGNGNYAFIDTPNEAHKVLVDQTSGTLVTIAKDVKLQIEFNPKHVAQYRLIGYENRILAKEDFNDDKKDAGEIGAGHAVTALYELVPAGKEADASQPEVDKLEFQTERQPTEAANSNVMMKLKLRYKQPDGDTSTLVVIPVENESVSFEKASDDVRFAAAVAGFGMQLRRSPYVGTWTLSDVQEVAKSAKGEDDYLLRAEFVELVRKASELMGQE